MKALFINHKDLVRHTPISGNLDFDKLVQYVEIAQDIHIHGLLGTNLYEKLQADILSDSLSGDYAILVDKYIKPTLAQYALLEYLPFAMYTINNKGLFKSTAENAETVTRSEVNAMTEAARDTAQHYATRMVDYLINYPNKFPEYLVNQKEQMSPNRRTNFGGWNI